MGPQSHPWLLEPIFHPSNVLCSPKESQNGNRFSFLVRYKLQSTTSIVLHGGSRPLPALCFLCCMLKSRDCVQRFGAVNQCAKNMPKELPAIPNWGRWAVHFFCWFSQQSSSPNFLVCYSPFLLFSSLIIYELCLIRWTRNTCQIVVVIEIKKKKDGSDDYFPRWSKLIILS